MKETALWMICILITTLMTYGCGIMEPNSPELAILGKQIAVLEVSLNDARNALANGDLSKDDVVKALVAQLESLKAQHAELSAAFAALGQKAGLAPELAVPLGGVGATVLYVLGQLLLGSRAAKAKARRSNTTIFGELNKLKNA